MNNKIPKAFKKLLGSGRAWLCLDGFTSEFLDVLSEPLSDLKERLSNMKNAHFPTYYQDKNNIVNGEELFAIKNIEGKTLTERAANVEAQWKIFSGFQTYKQLELILQKKGLPVVVIEDLEEYWGEKAIGNGNLQVENETYDPVVVSDDENVFFVRALDFLTDEQVETLIDTVVKNRQAHLAIYYLPRYLLIEDIHEVKTVEEMEELTIEQFFNGVE